MSVADEAGRQDANALGNEDIVQTKESTPVRKALSAIGTPLSVSRPSGEHVRRAGTTAERRFEQLVSTVQELTETLREGNATVRDLLLQLLRATNPSTA